MIVGQMERSAVEQRTCRAWFPPRQVVAHRRDLNQALQVMAVQFEVRFPGTFPMLVRIPELAFIITLGSRANVIPPDRFLWKRGGLHDVAGRST